MEAMDTPILVIARLTVREAARRRLLLALLVLTAIVIALSAWGFGRLPSIRDHGQPISPAEVKTIASQLLILLMFMFSGVIALSSVFVAAPSIAGEIESGIALSILARPLRRRDIVLGKWLGLAALVTIYVVGAMAIEFALVNVLVSYAPPHPFAAMAYLVSEGLVLLTLAMLFSTRLPGMTGGIIATVLFFVTWMLGVIGGFGTAFNNATVTHVGTVSKLLLPTDGLWRGTIFSLEPAAVLALGSNAAGRGNPFFSAAPPTMPYLIWCLFWAVAILGLAMYSFGRREV